MKNERFFYMVRVAQLVRASDCGSEGRGFEPHLSPRMRKDMSIRAYPFSISYNGHCKSFMMPIIMELTIGIVNSL